MPKGKRTASVHSRLKSAVAAALEREFKGGAQIKTPGFPKQTPPGGFSKQIRVFFDPAAIKRSG
jgi:hypothetical protein